MDAETNRRRRARRKAKNPTGRPSRNRKRCFCGTGLVEAKEDHWKDKACPECNPDKVATEE